MKRFNNCYIYNHKTDSDPEDFTGRTSQTVPDMSLSIPELLARHTRGMTVPQHDGQFHGEDLPDVSKLDRFERLELAHNIRNNIADIRADLSRVPVTPPSLPPTDKALEVPKPSEEL